MNCRGGENPFAVRRNAPCQNHAAINREIIRRGKKPCMARHAAHPARARIVDHSAQHMPAPRAGLCAFGQIDFFGRRDARESNPQAEESECASSPAARKYSRAANSFSGMPLTRRTISPSRIKPVSLYNKSRARWRGQRFGVNLTAARGSTPDQIALRTSGSGARPAVCVSNAAA